MMPTLFDNLASLLIHTEFHCRNERFTLGDVPRGHN